MLDDEVPDRKLVRIEVEKLLGRFNHELAFDPSWEFLIVHGPNGVGKTKLLELVHCTFAGRFHALARIPFKTARFQFEDGSSVQVSRSNGSADAPALFDDHSSRSHTPRACRQLKWTAQIPNSVPAGHVIDLEFTPNAPPMLRRLAREIGLEQIEPTLWLDPVSEDVIDAHELASMYDIPIPYRPDDLKHPEDPLALTGGDPQTPTGLEKVEEFLEDLPVHLIQIQRLLGTARQRQTHGWPHKITRQYPTVVSYARDLSSKLRAALAENSRTSQTLDRSFPNRLFEQTETNHEAEETIRKHYDAQLELRARLAAINILDSSPELQLPERNLNEWELTALSTYLNDTDKKLKTFLPLLERLEFMRSTVNKRFLFNKLEIDQESGFLFRGRNSDESLSPQELSSGEQHQLVLMYDLLMKAKERTLVLIDEPEISLHVAWQKAFLDDLVRIAELGNLRFIVATHSPQIIGDWWDRTAQLYKPSPSRS